MELAKTFDSKSAEEKWFRQWIDLGYFKADPSRGGKVFSIVIPPPNVTGQLHLGHALNVTLQDIIVRTRRMQGYNTLWVPGTDHAGIATQNAVEKDLAREGKTRHQLGREKFVERVWQWKETYGGRILHQLRRLGASCDWSRERFTLDPGLSRAVTEVFTRLYHEKLIYKDRRLINWCPRCETALSDLEVEHKETRGNLYYIRYPFADGSDAITVATTRPETMLGDTAVAVNPADPRFSSIVGRRLRLPLLGREIPVIADAAVDREFGTGAVKITPAHDFNDFEIGRRHGLEQISVMDTRGVMNEAAGPYRGMDRDACRRKVVADLEAQGLLEKIEPHMHAVGTCSRCDTVVEPMLSEQWFVHVKPLAEKAIAAVREGRTRFIPEFWENTYFNWMENIHDWCISRQLWWGHRIPAYRCARCKHLMVAPTRPERCEQCSGPDLTQDDDVLDTWFSSALWPFSTLGWPDQTPELARYYPTSLLITGFDIIFFWVARMMMMGLWFTGEVPFRDVYITPLVRDKYGKKMTKSRGNVVDPLDLMDRYGTDALRLTLAHLSVQGRDVVLSDDRLAASRAFANKVWNAARFVLMNLEGARAPIERVETPALSLADRWILSRLDNATREITRAIDEYEFNVASMAVYQFAWHEFCDWYIELSKDELRGGGRSQAAARWVLVRCLDRMLRLLHPFMPFVTEEIWQTLRPYIDEPGLAGHLVVARFPEPSADAPLGEEASLAMERCIEATVAINRLRALLGFHPGQRARGYVGFLPEAGAEASFARWRPYAMALGKLESFERVELSGVPPARSASDVLKWGQVWVEAPEGFDFEKARQELTKRRAEVQKHIEQHEARWNNPEFRAKVPQEKQDEMHERFLGLAAQREMLDAQLQQLERSDA